MAIIDFASLSASYEGCEIKDLSNKNCQTCARGFGNYKGRCFVVSDRCSVYAGDECIKCRIGTLNQGICPWRL